MGDDYPPNIPVTSGEGQLRRAWFTSGGVEVEVAIDTKEPADEAQKARSSVIHPVAGGRGVEVVEHIRSERDLSDCSQNRVFWPDTTIA